MQEINTLTFERLPQEMDTSSARERRVREVAKTSELLAKDAEEIPAVLNGVRMSGEDRQVFESYARALQEHAGRLSALARKGSVSEFEGTMGQIIATCVDCHDSFRVLPLLARSPR